MHVKSVSGTEYYEYAFSPIKTFERQNTFATTNGIPIRGSSTLSRSQDCPWWKAEIQLHFKSPNRKNNFFLIILYDYIKMRVISIRYFFIFISVFRYIFVKLHLLWLLFNYMKMLNNLQFEESQIKFKHWEYRNSNIESDTAFMVWIQKN